MGVARPNGHTPPSTCPVIVAASSGASIVAFPPSTALTFLLSSRASPHTTASTARPPTPQRQRLGDLRGPDAPRGRQRVCLAARRQLDDLEIRRDTGQERAHR